jgi:SAM-dependent methyltransferase
VPQLCRSVTGVDRNAAMLSRCRAKLQPGEDGARVTLQHGEAEALPFPDASFDAAYACQVFHHFDPADDHAMARQVLRELQRVLRPGGTIFINLCTPKNTSDGLWWSPLIPTATESYCARCIEPEWLRAAWRSLCTTTTPHEAAGVSPASSGCDDGVQWITHNSELFTDASFYMNLAGPLEKSWRDTDSTWAMAAPAELAQALAAIRGMLVRPNSA